MTLSTNTPGWFGYVAAILVTCFVCPALLLIPGLMQIDGIPNVLGALVIYIPIVGLASCIVGFPLAATGAVVLHVLCRGVPSQAVHVLAAGAVALIGGVAYWHLFFGPHGIWSVGSALTDAWVGGSIGLAAAAGRAAVIPLVASRRRLAAEGRLTGTAR